MKIVNSPDDYYIYDIIMTKAVKVKEVPEFHNASTTTDEEQLTIYEKNRWR